jgi:putative tryptophan/tyrosine transport system substrate-binding protein
MVTHRLIVKKKIPWVMLAAFILAGFQPAVAQQAGKIPRIGYLSPGSTTTIPAQANEAYRQGLRDLGWIEGQNIVIEYRFAEGKTERFPELAAELVQRNVDVIVAFGVVASRAAKQATTKIPIIMGNADDDPVRQGLVASLAQPGGNVTGFTNIGSDLAGKRVELLKEIIPKLSRLGILVDSRGVVRKLPVPSVTSTTETFVKESEAVAKAFGIKLRPLRVKASEELDAAFRIAVQERVEALTVVTTGLIGPSRGQVIELAAKTRLPAMYSSSSFTLAGGLVSYASDDVERYRGIASYVDKILKGTKPADLPVQRPAKFELIINLNAAKQIGLTIPPNVLARADKVIK